MARSRPDWAPGRRTRLAIAKRLAAASSQMTTVAMAAMATSHPWFGELDAEHRASINLVVRAGVDGFVEWFATSGDAGQNNIFASAPRSLTRRISLQQTVELIRTTITTVEEQIVTVMPPGDRSVLQVAIVHYSREVAFDAATVYARAAETRGAWDARLEALVMDAVIRGEADESVVSRASTLGWQSPRGLAVVIGALPPEAGADDELRRFASRVGLDLLAAPQGDRLVVLMGGDFGTDDEAVAAASELTDGFGPGPIVVGGVVTDLTQAPSSARAALSGRRAATAWPAAPRPVSASSLLPERALSGDGHARRTLAREVYAPLAEHGGDLLLTLETFVESGTIEGTARTLFIHANTVRYRLGRIADITGYDPQHPRDAYSLRLALTLGRMLS